VTVRRLSIRLSLPVLLVLACTSAPRTVDSNAQARTDRVLASHHGKQELTEFAGVAPAGCLENSATTELCEWRLTGRARGWRALAEAIDTGDRINLICELPRSGAPRAPHSCSIHPRRSNRGSWRLPKRAKPGRRSSSSESRAQVSQRFRNTVDQWMVKADTLARLSRLMGALPDSCTRGTAGEQRCVWRTTSRTFGHGTLAIWIHTSKRNKIRLYCALPIDGSPRAPDSCFAEVGA
jgi:hypothetical protein